MNKAMPIVLLPKGSISESDKKRLRDAGICTVTVEDPGRVIVLQTGPSGQLVSNEEIFNAALKAASLDFTSRANFITAIAQEIGKREAPAVAARILPPPQQTAKPKPAA